MPGAFSTFDEVKTALGIGDKELHDIVARGELRAFRDQGMLKFRREDVDKFAAKGAVQRTPRKDDGGETDLTQTTESSEDTVDLSQPVGSQPATLPSMAPVDSTGQDDTSAIEVIAPSLELDESGDITQPIGEDASDEQTSELILEGDDAGFITEPPVPSEVDTVLRRAQAMAAERAEARETAPFFTALLGVSVVVLLIGSFAFIGALLGSLPEAIKGLFD